MSFYTTATNAKPAILPEAREQLITLPVKAASVAYQVSTPVTIDNIETRVPLVTGEPSAAWVAEGDEITPSDPTVNDLVITPKKVAGLTVVSNEMATDSSPAAQGIIGSGIANDIAKKVDTAFFGNTTTNGPKGVKSLTTSTVTGPAAWADMDPFAEAISKVESYGVKPTAFVMNSTEALALAQLKESGSSNKPLLGPDPTNPTRRQMQGVPIIVSGDVDDGTVWLIPAERVIVATRAAVDLEVDRSVYFTSDRLAIRATMRIGWGFVQPLAIVKVSLDKS